MPRYGVKVKRKRKKKTSNIPLGRKKKSELKKKKVDVIGQGVLELYGSCETLREAKMPLLRRTALVGWLHILFLVARIR